MIFQKHIKFAWAWIPFNILLTTPRALRSRVSPRDTLSRSSADRFDTKSPIHRETPPTASWKPLRNHFRDVLSFPRRVSVILIQRVRSKLRDTCVVHRDEPTVPTRDFFSSRRLRTNSIIAMVRASVGVVRSSLYFMRHLPPSLSLFTEHTEWKTRYITKENKFSVKAKCYELRHKHPVERATPEARTYALVCIRERKIKRREREKEDTPSFNIGFGYTFAFFCYV